MDNDVIFTEKSGMRRHTVDKPSGTPDCYSAIHLPETIGKTSLTPGNFRDGDQSSLTVAVRVRPFNNHEQSQSDIHCIVSVEDKQTTVKTETGHIHNYSFDYSFWSFNKEDNNFADQHLVYESLAAPLLKKALQGYNISLFAYGQTGSGKSFSMMGHTEEEGIIPRFSRELFLKSQNTENIKVKTNLEISFFEIYNEKIHDLLSSKKDKADKKISLKVREHPVLGPYIEGLSTFVVNSFEDIQTWIVLGSKNRATASTGMNDKSSRSHSIFTMVLTQTKFEDLNGEKHEHSISSRINLIDLAGSERQSTSQSSGERLREGININKSLMTLGKVICLLSEVSSNASKKKKVFIPYRDSVLTWLLKESLGGNSRTAMLATISPANIHCEETLTSCIVNRVRINEDTKSKKIQELLAEIERLKRLTSKGRNIEHEIRLAEITSLRSELSGKEKELQNLKRTWEIKLTESEKMKKKQLDILQNSGIIIKMDKTLPHLVNLSEDPQISEVLLYLIKDGNTHVGHSSSDSVCDIQLIGALISKNHCVFINKDGVVTLSPVGNALCYINGVLIKEPTILQHGDRVILGGNHYFRFMYPMKSSDSKENSKSACKEVRDFDFAHKELIRVQELRLAQQLEDTKNMVQKELYQKINEEKQNGFYNDNQLIQNGDRPENTLLKELEKAKGHAEENLKQLSLYQNETELKSKSLSISSESSNSSSFDSYNQAMLMINSLSAIVNDAHGKSQFCVENLKERQCNLESNQFNTPLSAKRKQKLTIGSFGLYHTYLAICEANAICWHLKKNIVFSREDYFDDENNLKMLIKCSLTDMKICTFWSFEVFMNKLHLLRDVYQTGDNNIEEIIADENNWKKDDNFELTDISSPENCGLPVVIASPEKSLMVMRRCSLPNHIPKRSRIKNISKNTLSSVLSKIIEVSPLKLPQGNTDDIQPSYTDLCLECCKTILQSVNEILILSAHVKVILLEENVEKELIELSSVLFTLSSYYNSWFLCQNMASFSHLCNSLITALKKLKFEMMQFFKAFSTQCKKSIQEIGGNINNCIEDIILKTAKYSLVTNQLISLPCVDLDIEINNSNILKIFLESCKFFIINNIQEAIKNIDQVLLPHLIPAAINVTKLDLSKAILHLVATIKLFLKESCKILTNKFDSSWKTKAFFTSHMYKNYQSYHFNTKKLVASGSSLILVLKTTSSKDKLKKADNVIMTVDEISSTIEKLFLLLKEPKSGKPTTSGSKSNSDDSDTVDVTEENSLKQLEGIKQETLVIANKLKSIAEKPSFVSKRY
uniref:Kinesin motor domain-containing protein n=1 Tax=Octopus bimaculoides TaxID=37653 RepID=A0A0L8G5V4_OCTBM